MAAHLNVIRSKAVIEDSWTMVNGKVVMKFVLVKYCLKNSV